MDRRKFLVSATSSGILVAMICGDAEARRPRNIARIDVTGAREGESLSAFLKRRGHRLEDRFAERQGDTMLTRVTKSNGDWLYGPMWTPPPNMPDQRAPVGWPGIVLRVYNPKTRLWIWSERAMGDIELVRNGKVRLEQVGYDPRVASVVDLNLGALV